MATAAPEWTRDEQSIDDAKNYLRSGSTVDFFELVARSILRSHPDDLPAFCLNLVNSVAAGKEVPAESDLQPQPAADGAYMQEAGVSEFVDAWVLALLRERPRDDVARLEFHKRYLESLMS